MTVLDYRDMAADSVRVGAFRRAIGAVVRPGDVVVDVGCGLGTYAVFACRAGARRVYAIEREDIIVAAREIARANGCADRIRFIRGDALTARLPERADVVVTEDFSTAFVESETERLIRRVVRRFLRPRGRVIPLRVTLWAAPVSCPRLHRRADPWAESNGLAYGVDFSAARSMSMNCMHRARFARADLVAGAQRAHGIDVLRMSPFPFRASLRFRARRAAAVHGLAVWFDADLAPGVRLSNAPGAPPTLWGQAFLPLERAVRVRRGGTVAVELAALFSRDSDRTWWQWEVTAGEYRAEGSTFRGFPLSGSDLVAGSRDHRPGLSAEGAVTGLVLQMMKSRCTIVGIAKSLRGTFPGRFPALRDALARVSSDARRYGIREGQD